MMMMMMMHDSATSPDFRGNIASIHPRSTPGACRASFEWARHYPAPFLPPRITIACFIIRAGGYDAVRENSRSR